MPVGADLFGHLLDRRHQRVAVGEGPEAHPIRMHLAQELRGRRRGHRLDGRTDESAIQTLIDLGYARRRLELALVDFVIAAERSNVVEGPRLDARDVASGDEFGVLGLAIDAHQHEFVKPRRHRVDQVHVEREFLMLLRGDRTGHEDAEVTYALVQ